MPHHESFKKSLKQDAKRRLRNRQIKSNIHTMMKKVKLAENKEDMEKMLPSAYSALDRATKKGVIHKNTASRKKSRLANFVAKQA